MRMRILSGLAGLCLLLALLPVRAAEPQTAAPGIVIRIKPIEALVADARYLAELSDKGDEFKQYEGIYKSMLKEKSLEGIDVSKPIGAYGTIGANGIDSKLVVLIPVADEKAIVDFMTGKGITPEKDKDGLYKVDVPNSPVGSAYFRFANKYAYVTMGEKDNIKVASLLDPTKVLPANFPSVMAITLDFDKIPDELKKVAIGQTAGKYAELKEQKMPDETDAQYKFKGAMLDEMADWTKMLLNDGGELSIALDLDRQKGDASLALSLAGKPGSKLAKTFTDLATTKSVGAGLIGKDSAVNFLMHVALPERLRLAMEPVFEEGYKKALAEEKDKDKREAGEKLYKALMPSLKSGEVDFGMNISGPSAAGKYAVVVAGKIKDGPTVEKTIKEIVASMPEKDKKNVTLDFAKAGTVSIHKIAGGELDEQQKKLFGEGPAYFAVRDDAAMLSLGDGALEALKTALATQPAASKALQFEMSVSRIIQMMPPEQQKAAQEAAKKIFAKDKDADKMTFALEAGNALKLRFNMKTALIGFFNQVGGGAAPTTPASPKKIN